jgi:hypothetical protein
MNVHPLPVPLRCRVIDEGDRLELRVWRGAELVVAVPPDPRRAARLAADLATAAARRLPRHPCHGREDNAP